MTKGGVTVSQCICCGREGADAMRYVCVATNTELVKPAGERRQKRIIRETVTEIRPEAVCAACAGKAKTKAVLMTIPITLVMTAVLTVLSFFTARPRRNIRQEVASMPMTLPLVAVILWICGLSVYLPRPKELYAAELVRKALGISGDHFLIPLDRRCFTRRERPLKAIDVSHRTAVKTDLAEKLLPLIEGGVGEDSARELIGQTFTKEEYTR